MAERARPGYAPDLACPPDEPRFIEELQAGVAMRRKTEAQRKKEAKERAAKALRKTKERYGLGKPGILKGVVASPLQAHGKRRTPRLASTSDRIPGSASSSNLLHDYKWKREAKETDVTVAEIRRKATQIAPAYNKGALQYLPSDSRSELAKRSEISTLRLSGLRPQRFQE